MCHVLHESSMAINYSQAVNKRALELSESTKSMFGAVLRLHLHATALSSAALLQIHQRVPITGQIVKDIHLHKETIILFSL
jgi:hypothetical protein